MNEERSTEDPRANAIATGRRVLRVEADALALYADTLGGPFADAVDAMFAIDGRVVVCGMGKSGHVAHKIAATLASTGTPAQFLHPAEASHGDLGMLTTKDLALVLSNSGGTPELTDVIAHSRRFSIPLVGVSSKAESPLLQAADIALVLPKAPQACTVGMAPTTSTTLTMALGDALAVALMERRRFTAENFRVFHPGGKLGAQLIKVADLMHGAAQLPLVRRDAPMPDALIEISARGFGVVGVLDEGDRLIGVISDGDLRRNMEGLLERRAGDVATPGPATIGPNALAQEALALMNKRKITSLFVIDPAVARPVGILHVHDCLRAGLDQA
jgi:arabinose-5-phosphate isomerase